MNFTPDLRLAATRHVSRRWFFRDCGLGLANIALARLLQRDAQAAPASPLAPHAPPFAAKARRVIYLFQAGAPSHLDLFDNKPELTKRNGQLPPAELLKNYRAAFINPNSALLGPKFQFAPRGIFSTLSAAWPRSGARIRRNYSFGEDSSSSTPSGRCPGSREISAL